MSQRSATKTWSLIKTGLQSKTHLSSPSIVSGIHRSSLCFRIGKTGFKIPRYQNTYRLESYKPFNCETVDKILIDVMQYYLKDLKYQPQICMQICQRMTAEIRDQICKNIYDRYKVVVIISIVQKLGQNVQTGFGKLWDVQKDTYSTHVIETPEFVALGLVVGLYYE